MKLIKLLFTAFALLLCGGIVFAHDFEQDGIYYNILSKTNKTVEVTFKGDYYGSYKNEYSGSVVIPESATNGGITYKVISIRYSAFRDCSNLSSLTIGKGVTSIGNQAFYDCSKLDTVINYSPLTITQHSSSYGYVGYYADRVINADEQVGNFYFKTIDGVHYLSGYLGNDKDLQLPENYQGNSYAIGDKAFYDCDSLTSIVIPDAVTSIRGGAFMDCN